MLLLEFILGRVIVYNLYLSIDNDDFIYFIYFIYIELNLYLDVERNSDI